MKQNSLQEFTKKVKPK